MAYFSDYFTNLEFQTDSMQLVFRTEVIILAFLFTLFQFKQPENFVEDIDGNRYGVIRIGNYLWMAENLKVSRYNDGEKIKTVSADDLWRSSSEGLFTYYMNDSVNLRKYGMLYNWYAVNSGRLCPKGWHVPSDEEWKILEGYADSKYKYPDEVWNRQGVRGSDAGSNLMSVYGWRVNVGADKLGFKALPGGEMTDKCKLEGINGYWWTSTQKDSLNSWYRSLIYGLELISRDTHPKFCGFSVRCVKS